LKVAKDVRFKMKIYFDNAATTKVDEKVLKAMIPYFSEKYGNASSQHLAGTEGKIALEDSRKKIAKKINGKSPEIIFTSGGTEGNNFVLKGLWFYQKERKTGKDHIITTKVEHDCILRTCKWLESQGCKVTYLDVDSEGFVNLEDLESAINEKTFLVSIIHGNNEIGTIQDLEKLGKVCSSSGVLFHTDACQSFTKVPIDVKKMSLDFMTLNSHKIHGPKGVGAIFIKENLKEKIVPLMHGGGHEYGLRSGTENVSGIVGFAKSSEVISKKEIQKMEKLRNKIIEGLLDIEGVKLNGAEENRLCNNVNVTFSDVEGEAIGGFLESYGIYTSTGSACRTHTNEPSHVLRAIGLNEENCDNSLRISISKYTTEKEVDYFLKKIKGIIKKLRRFG
jgi:cysteine desulfurase